MRRFSKFLIQTLRRRYRRFVEEETVLRGLSLAERARVVSPEFLTFGKDVVIDYGAYVHCGHMSWCPDQGRVTIGEGSYVGPYAVIFGMGEVEIGAYVMVSPHVVISSVKHPYVDASSYMYQQPRVYGRIRIEDDVYLGSNVVVTPGVTIGKGAVIGAGAVVTHDIEPYAIAVWVPARVVRSRFAGGHDELAARPGSAASREG